MKRIFALLVLAGLLLSCISAGAEGELTMKELNTTDAFVISLKRVARLTPPYTMEYKHYHVQQGAATDGKYAYTILENQVDDLCSIWKLDLNDFSVVETKYALDLDHGNDMTYNPLLNQLLVVHNKPRYTRVSFVDPETLEILDAKTMPYQIYSMAYEPVRDQYIIGISGSYDFVILDKDFKRVQRFKGTNTGLVKQGVDCDENYIYFPQCTSNATKNVIMVYDWEGNFVTQIRVQSFQEIESLFHIGDDWYITFNASGSYIYKATLKLDKKK
ncbi:MAG: hypothetical protein IKM26_06900 [Clostridia bacterium]|nr:hypothetical protein [Clostridia bacterium]